MQPRGNRRLVNRSALASLFLAATTLFCQDAPRVNIVPGGRPSPVQNLVSRPSSIRLDVKMVLVPASVTDHSDKPIVDLRKEDFHVFEDAVEQKIESFSSEPGPVSLGIVFDSSGSMKNKLEGSLKAIERFLGARMQGDEFFLVRFNDSPELRTGFTSDPAFLMSSLGLVEAQGWTALHDAICLAVHKMKSAKNARKALLILSDGGDNNSRYSEGEVMSLLREADVRVYAVGLFDQARFLRKAADTTGGGLVVIHNMNDLPEAMDKLSDQLRHQYVLGYYPPPQQKNDGKFRKVKVSVSAPSAEKLWRTSWRHGYYSPVD
jgi:Ca-activated chloride channel homolog